MENIFNLKKISYFSFFFILLLLLNGCSSTQNQYSSQDNVQNEYNLDELNGYGEWVQVNNYGTVWKPYVVDGWMPFDNGHWTFADGNWTWISYEPFGWIVYHYGYWYNDPFYGWVWYPSDTPWSPARVMWANYDDYVSWVPIPPAGISYGNPLDMNDNKFWHVVKREDFANDNIHNFRIINPIRNETGSVSISKKSPDRKEIEKFIGKPINEIKLQLQTVTLSQKKINKINLPVQENKRVEQNSSRVRKEVLVPKDEYRKRKSENDTKRDKKK